MAESYRFSRGFSDQEVCVFKSVSFLCAFFDAAKRLPMLCRDVDVVLVGVHLAVQGQRISEIGAPVMFASHDTSSMISSNAHIPAAIGANFSAAVGDRPMGTTFLGAVENTATHELHPAELMQTHARREEDMAVRRRLIDIGANLTDPMFRGLYNGSRKHPDDLDQVLHRAQANGVHRILVTGGSLDDSQRALELASSHGKCSGDRMGVKRRQSRVFLE
ncbi:hypothetical protein HPB48_023163 [Haemaphysalis longicornis]|uniref:Uncharacterized protein n=1 Tax=Haemaphysalis longicornis TaxID=44386 RepID=A0A9J6H6Y0_HAELO|nr:hypothetical protein HPB48_023163 [Haemaphysalis longicornis]